MTPHPTFVRRIIAETGQAPMQAYRTAQGRLMQERRATPRPVTVSLFRKAWNARDAGLISAAELRHKMRDAASVLRRAGKWDS